MDFLYKRHEEYFLNHQGLSLTLNSSVLRYLPLPALLSSIFMFYTSFWLIAFSGAPGTAGLELLMNMFGGLGAGSLSVPNQQIGRAHV